MRPNSWKLTMRRAWSVEMGCPRRRRESAGPARADDGKVESSFRRGHAIAADHARRFVNFQELLRVKRAFIQPCGRDREAQWPLAHDCAEISARSEHPSALIKTPSDLRKGSSQILKASARFFRRWARRDEFLLERFLAADMDRIIACPACRQNLGCAFVWRWHFRTGQIMPRKSNFLSFRTK